MARRKVIKIDEEKCNGCGLCIPNCPEGALEIRSGKACLISEIVCDGLGACLGECPEGAISIEYREAESYDETAVMANLLKQDQSVIDAHLRHLQEHGETELFRQANEYLRSRRGRDIAASEAQAAPSPVFAGCPGSRSTSFKAEIQDSCNDDSPRCSSQLTHWPIQMHLIQPLAPHFHGSNLLLAADCVAHAYAEFHRDFLRGKTLIIACPKLDEGQDIYLEKLVALIDQAEIKSITVAIMEVPCCSGLLRMIQAAVNRASRKIPVECSVMGIQGRILEMETVSAISSL
jgi:Fe-S-cluster-containing hydrogenase component 2